MKNLLLMALLMCGAVLYAQDVIIKTDGSELKGKVTEVAADVIKYHRADNLDGPVYNLPKTEVFMVLYGNGSRETFTTPRTENKPAAPVAAPVLSKYDSLMKLSKQQKTIGILFTVAGPIMLTAGAVEIALGTRSLNNTEVLLHGVVGGLWLALGTFEIIYGPALLVKAKKTKQQALQYKTTSAIITYPMPAMVQGKAPGVAFSMRF